MKKNSRSVTGWTCTCCLNRLGVEVGDLMKNKEDVECYDTYWNHDEDGKPVKVTIHIDKTIEVVE